MLGDTVRSECAIEEIQYHGMMLDLPAERIVELLGVERNNMLLAKCDEVTYYQPR